MFSGSKCNSNFILRIWKCAFVFFYQYHLRSSSRWTLSFGGRERERKKEKKKTSTDVTQGRRNAAPNETRTHSWRCARLARKPLHRPRLPSCTEVDPMSIKERLLIKLDFTVGSVVCINWNSCVTVTKNTLPFRHSPFWCTSGAKGPSEYWENWSCIILCFAKNANKIKNIQNWH